MSDAHSPTRSIAGVTNRFQIPRIGKIRLGVRAQTATGTAPKEVPHFVVPPEVARVYGAQPTSLLIMFPLNDRNEIFPQENVWYGTGTGKKCYGDGTEGHCLWAHLPATGTPKPPPPADPNQRITIPCPCPLYRDKACTPKGLLRFFLPQISLSGIYEIGTPSIANLVRINSALTLLQNLLGKLAMVPLTLYREPVKMQWNGSLRTHYLLALKFEGDLQAVEQIRNGATIAVPALPPAPGEQPLSPPSPARAQPSTSTVQPPPSGAANGTRVQVPKATPAPATPTVAASAPAAAEAQVPKSAATPDATGTPPAKPAPPGTPQCRCGRTVTATVAEYSRRLFAEVLCIPCQKSYGSSATR